MFVTTTDWPDVIDVLVTQDESGLFVYYVQTADERAVHTGYLDARTKRAALIELTSMLAGSSYQPTERWDTTEEDESLRRFRSQKAAP